MVTLNAIGLSRYLVQRPNGSLKTDPQAAMRWMCDVMSDMHRSVY
jgi:hypothetical protein